MMGFQGTAERLFYDFCLDEHIPFDHILRGVDRHLDLDELRQSLKPFYRQMGRPAVDPELMIRMLIVGYSMGIRSERGLCDEVHPQSGLSLVLPARTEWQGSRSLDALDTAAFERATCCGAFSRAWCSAVLPRAWLAPTGLHAREAKPRVGSSRRAARLRMSGVRR